VERIGDICLSQLQFFPAAAQQEVQRRRAGKAWVLIFVHNPPDGTGDDASESCDHDSIRSRQFHAGKDFDSGPAQANQAQ
jgi:hypothetical protein